jgi:protease PrsW
MFPSDLAPGFVAACAVAPALLLLWLVVAADSRPEPPRVVWTCVVLGVLSVLPIAMLEIWLTHHVPFAADPVLAAGETAFLVAALPEEAGKIAIIAAMALKSREFDEPMDGVVYGVAVGLGFAAVENLFYVEGSTNLAAVAGMRGVLSVPFHGALGAIAGSYIARARFGGALGAHKGDGAWRGRLFGLAFVIPFVLHGLFDWSVLALAALGRKVAAAPSAGGGGLILLLLLAWLVVGFGAIAFAVALARRIARRQQKWLGTRRLPPGHWRAIWARSLSGLGLSVVAVALLIAGDSIAKFAGLAAGAVAIAISAHCAKYLNEAAQVTQRPAAAERIGPP